MLVLTRKTNESIVIDGPCVITVVEMRRNNVKIGIEADMSVNIVRNEIVPPVPESSTKEEFRNEDRGVSVE